MVRRIGTVLLFLIVSLCLLVTIVPRFLDAVYYRGPAGGHFDGARFFNPDGDDDAVAPPSGAKPRANFLLRYILGNDGRPRWPEHVAIHPVAPPARVEGDAMLATWVGHATVLVQTQGLNILTDPVWSRTVGPLGIGPARVAEPGIAFDRLPKIDLVLVSHNHYDHMDLATLKRLWDRDRPIIITSLGNDALLRSAGIPGRFDTTDCGHCPGVQAMDWGETAQLAWFDNPWSGNRRSDRFAHAEVVVTRNHHWGSRWFADRNRALWSSFVVRLPGGNLFFAGDTGAGDLAWADQAARYGPVRLALIPIGAFRFTPGQMGAGSHIGPIDAVEAYRRLGATTGIGIHWGTFRLSYEAYDTPPRLLAAVAKAAGVAGFGTVALGRPVSIAPYRARPRLAPVDRAAMARRLPKAALALP